MCEPLSLAQIVPRDDPAVVRQRLLPLWE